MITIGIDPHKQSHTAAAVNAATGELCDQLTISSDRAGHEQLLDWARNLGDERQSPGHRVCDDLVEVGEVELHPGAK